MSLSESTLNDDRTTLVQKARYLRLSSETIAGGMRTGSFRSLYKGQGIEFSGVREYLRGDDVRAIDWNVTARMGKPFVKMFEEERELIVFLVVDCSFSMETGSGSTSRLQTAAETGALLTLASGQNSSPVGAVFFDGEIRFSCAPEIGRNHEMLILSRFDAMKPETNGSALSNALTGAYKILKKRSLVIVISDFRTTEYSSPLASLALKHDVIAVRITDPSDFELPQIGTLSFSDVEGSSVRRLPTSSKSFAHTWRESENNRADRFHAMCLKRGVIPLSISTNDEPAQCLTRFFATRNIKC